MYHDFSEVLFRYFNFKASYDRVKYHYLKLLPTHNSFQSLNTEKTPLTISTENVITFMFL